MSLKLHSESMVDIIGHTDGVDLIMVDLDIIEYESNILLVLVDVTQQALNLSDDQAADLYARVFMMQEREHETSAS